MLSPLCGTSRGRKLGGHLSFSYHEIVSNTLVDKLCFTWLFPLAINFHKNSEYFFDENALIFKTFSSSFLLKLLVNTSATPCSCNSISKKNFHLLVYIAFGEKTIFSALVSPAETIASVFFGGREATTGNTSAFRCLCFVSLK